MGRMGGECGLRMGVAQTMWSFNPEPTAKACITGRRRGWLQVKLAHPSRERREPLAPDSNHFVRSTP